MLRLKARYSFLDMKEYDKISEVGYQYIKEQLQEVNLEPLLMQGLPKQLRPGKRCLLKATAEKHNRLTA